jgi:cystathionine beta-lyase
MAMKYNFDEVLRRRGWQSVKWSRFDVDVIPVWLADMDFVSPEPVVRALHEVVERGVFGYPEGISGQPQEILEFRNLIIDHVYRLYHWKVTPEDLVFLPGVVTAFNLACHALASPGGGVVTLTPVYPPILQAPGDTKTILQDVQMVQDSHGMYGVNWSDFESAFNDQTRLFLLCNPHNPLGRVFRQDELERMAEVCLQRGITICSDEIHCDMIFSGYRHIPIATIDPEIAQNTITLIAPTKTYNLAGLQCSIMIIQNPAIRIKLHHARQGLVGWVNLMGLAAGQAAYRDGQEWLEQLLAYVEANRDYLFDFVMDELPGISMVKPEGTYLAWLDCREIDIDGSSCEFFLKNARVALGDGMLFGKGGEKFVRLSFACPRAILVEALHRMKNALVSYKPVRSVEHG